jgi:putative endonuclease
MRNYYVYILTTRKNTVLYTGVTSDIEKRLWEHKEEIADGFTKDYSVKKLVYLEIYQDVKEAIHREKCIKRWKREWKVKLIEEANPEWNDLSGINGHPIPAFAGMTAKD